MTKKTSWISYLILLSVIGYILGSITNSQELAYWFFFNFGPKAHKILRQSKDVINVILLLLALTNVMKPNKFCALSLLVYFFADNFVIYEKAQLYNSSFVFWSRSLLPLLIITQLCSNFPRVSTLLRLTWLIQISFFMYMTLSFPEDITNEIRNVIYFYLSTPVNTSLASSMMLTAQVLLCAAALIVTFTKGQRSAVFSLFAVVPILMLFPVRYENFGIEKLIFYAPLAMIPFVMSKLSIKPRGLGLLK